MVNKKGEVGQGIYILLIVFLSLIVLAAFAPTTADLFRSLGSNSNGFVGFIITNFNSVILFALTILALFGFKALGSD